MSVKIRLERIGAKGQPSYRVVVVDERKPRSGSAIEIIGHYNPRVEPSAFDVDKEKALEWIKKGAQLSPVVRKMFSKAGVIKHIDFSTYKKKAPRQKKSGGEEAAAAKPEATAAKPEAPKAEEKPA